VLQFSWRGAFRVQLSSQVSGLSSEHHRLHCNHSPSIIPIPKHTKSSAPCNGDALGRWVSNTLSTHTHRQAAVTRALRPPSTRQTHQHLLHRCTALFHGVCWDQWSKRPLGNDSWQGCERGGVGAQAFKAPELVGAAVAHGALLITLRTQQKSVYTLQRVGTPLPTGCVFAGTDTTGNDPAQGY